MGFESFFAHACSFYSVLTNLSPSFSDTADLRRTLEFEIQQSQVPGNSEFWCHICAEILQLC